MQESLSLVLQTDCAPQWRICRFKGCETSRLRTWGQNPRRDRMSPGPERQSCVWISQIAQEPI
jgi:hypothetical protein